MTHRLLLIVGLLSVFFCVSGQAEERTDREFQECRNCPVMVAIPGGRFVMGSPQNEPGRFDAEGPQHAVSVKAFALGKFDITSEQFLIFLKDTGYQPKPCNPILNMSWRSPGEGLAYTPTEFEPPRWPAVCLDWHDAEAFVAWLNTQVRKEHPALGNRDGPYRLPSEAEWEYAARAGTTTARWWGEDIGSGHANCNGCGSTWDNHLLNDVSGFPPNPFGLYGMLGTAWQWTADCWHPSYVDAPTDSRVWQSKNCTKHVIRGGSWDNVPIFVRSAARSASVANGGEYDYSSLAGFRVARDLP
ncbi:MAG: formylglycine-generating enzyme family protein [Proteobacteria bacterium]|nr:formylglycine-generating enzyme family protein [Pseudomonadota bacterium]